MISDGWFRPKERDADEIEEYLNTDIMSASQKVDDADVLSRETVTSPKTALSNDTPLPELP